MAAQTFTVLNNGITSYNVTGIVFSTPAGTSHRADLSNFGGSAAYTLSGFFGTTLLAPGQSRTFSIDYFYQSGAQGTRSATITINTDAGISRVINVTIYVGSASVTIISPLPGQGTYTASAQDIITGRGQITLNVNSNGVFSIVADAGADLNSAWTSPVPSSVGDSYWVRFTRQTISGSGDYFAQPSTGWLQLNQNRSIVAAATGLATGVSSTVSAQYLVEISSSSSGSPVVSSGVYTLNPTGSLGGLVIPLPDVDILDNGNYATAQAGIRFNTDGTRTRITYALESSDTSWYLNGPSNVGNSYYIRASHVEGSFVNYGQLNTWFQLNQSREWDLISNSNLTSKIFIELSTSPSSANVVSTCYATLTTAPYGNDSTASSSDGFGGAPDLNAGGYDGGGGGGSKVICTELYHQGFLEEDIYQVDQEYGLWLYNNNPAAYKGYRIWADILVNYMQGKGKPIIPRLFFWLNKDQQQELSQKIAMKVARALGKPFAYELARREGKYNKFNLGGYLLVTIGLKICSLIYKIFKGKK